MQSDNDPNLTTDEDVDVKNIADLPPIMSAEQLIESGLLPIGRSAIYTALKVGEIPARKVGKRYLISRERLREWLEKDENAE